MRPGRDVISDNLVIVNVESIVFCLKLMLISLKVRITYSNLNEQILVFSGGSYFRHHCPGLQSLITIPN